MDRKIFLWACITGGLGVVLGAFAAHGLKPLISVSAIEESVIKCIMPFCCFLLDSQQHSKPVKNQFYLSLYSQE